MNQEILNIILAMCGLSAIGFMIYYSYILNKKNLREFSGYGYKGHGAISFAEEARYNKLLDGVIYQIYEKTYSSNVSLARLHNNGYWNNGRSMKKFTIVLEKFRNGLSIMRDYKDVLCSRYPNAMDFMFYHDIYWCTDVANCEDNNLKRDMIKCGFQASYMFLIKQADGEHTEEAFIQLNFTEPTVLNEEQVAFIKSLRFDILGLLNMTKK